MKFWNGTNEEEEEEEDLNENVEAAMTTTGIEASEPKLPRAEAIWPPVYQNMDATASLANSNAPVTPNPTTTMTTRRRLKRTHRGFTTSISSMFTSSPTNSTSQNRTDCCSFACFGILQHDYTRYLLTGITPPSLFRRFMTHIFFPITTFLMAGWASLNIPDLQLNRIVCTFLLFIIVVSCGLGCCRSRQKRVEVRREMGRMGRRLEMEQEGGFVVGGGGEEQSDYDMNCAHAMCGCYRVDIPPPDIHSPTSQQEEDEDLCGCMWKFWTKACCASCCNYYYMFCGLCALAQEAREVEIMIPVERRRIDYVTFESYLDYYPKIQSLRQALAPNHTSLYTHFTTSLSKLSRKLCKVLAFVIVFLFLFSLIPGRIKGFRFYIGNFLVFVATFGQAFLILYFVHWKWHKFDLSLDAVVKYFACGFLLTTGLAFFFEMAESIVLRLFMTIIVSLSGVQVVKDEDGYNENMFGSASGIGGGVGIMGPYFSDKDENTAGGFDWLLPLLSGGLNRIHRSLGDQEADMMKEFSRKYPVVVILYLFLNAYALAALVEELCKYFGYKMIDHPDFLTDQELAAAAAAPELHEYDDASSVDASDSEHEHDPNHHSNSSNGGGVHDGYNATADVAATTTATTTNGTAEVNATADVAATPHQRDLNSIGAAITVAMVSVAVGFACCENLLYIFFYSGQTVGTELSVLIARSLFPIHPIAAAIQSIGVCKRDLEHDKSHKLGRIIFPSIVMHGTFDFNIMLISFISNLANGGGGAAAATTGDMNGVVAAGISFALSIVFTAGGIYYYYVESKAQKQRLSALDDTSDVVGVRTHLI